MPVARRSQVNARTTILVALTGFMIALVLAGGVVWLAQNGGEVQIQLGDTDFNAGQIGRISAEIDNRGPILYSDVAGRNRDLILQHLGNDPETGWFAFHARPLGQPRDCFWRWNEPAEQFDLVSETETVCADVTMNERGTLSTGETIGTYPVTIDNVNNVRVDINLNSTAKPKE